jgi:hypothetical protein
MDKFTDDELAIEEKRARMLADVCLAHGHMDGGKAHRSTAEALSQELVVRARRRGGE